MSSPTSALVRLIAERMIGCRTTRTTLAKSEGPRLGVNQDVSDSVQKVLEGGTDDIAGKEFEGLGLRQEKRGSGVEAGAAPARQGGEALRTLGVRGERMRSS